MPPKKTTTKSDKPKTSKKKAVPDTETKSKEEPEKKVKKKVEKNEKAPKITKKDQAAPKKTATRAAASKTELEESEENQKSTTKKVTKAKKTKDQDTPTENEVKPKKATKSKKLNQEPTEKDSNAEKKKAVTVRGKRAKKSETDLPPEDEEEEEVVKKGRKRKPAKAEQPELKDEPETKSTKLNATDTAWETLDFKCSSKNSKGDTSNFHITSWNVDGLRAWLKKGGLNILQYDNPDILCLQETKCSLEKLPDEVKDIEGYETLWCSSDKEGYAGVGIATKVKPISVEYGINSEEHDSEGRCITAEYENFFLVNVYVPNAGRKLVTLPKRLDWNTLFKEHIKKLDQQKPVIVCGDMNVAHEEIDLANPKTNTKNAGFTKEEREGMTDFLQDGYVDTFRKFYPDKEKAYTFWTYIGNARSKNVGWRLDYFIVSDRFMECVCDSTIHSRVMGSDHCPLSLHFNI